MATAPEEMADLSKAIGALLVNFGTIQNLDGMLAAGKSLPCHRVPPICVCGVACDVLLQVETRT